MAQSLYEIVGEDGFERLTQAFYARVPEDEILGPMYPPGQIEAARVRLRDFLVGRFGGPQRYVQQRGHPRLRMRHMPFPVDVRARDRWMELMTEALRDTGLPSDVSEVLLRYFGDTATFMINRAT
ncbi:MAG: globin [Bryobacterales bacterium]|nr:globin [Bryobacterales bacterium]MDE0627879.1 globin [Bryobacterales bacterium]